MIEVLKKEFCEKCEHTFGMSEVCHYDCPVYCAIETLIIVREDFEGKSDDSRK